MAEPDWSLRIHHLQRAADLVVREAAIEIEKLGGANAVDGYLNNSLCNLLGVAINEIGTQGAQHLMAGGLQTIKEFADQGAG